MQPSEPVPGVRLLARERFILSVILLVIVALAWIYMIWMPVAMFRTQAYFIWLVIMWCVMAIAMMLPTAVPFLMVAARVQSEHRTGASVPLLTLHVAAGYLLAWFGFAVLASTAQWLLERTGSLTPAMGQIRSAGLASTVLIGAGIFQLSPLKTSCLKRCRTPLAFLMTRWRSGRRGALLMGVENGIYCVGCCAALMLVLFVAGVMNLLWMVGLTILMLAEKLVPRGDRLARMSGVALIIAGADGLV